MRFEVVTRHGQNIFRMMESLGYKRIKFNISKFEKKLGVGFVCRAFERRVYGGKFPRFHLVVGINGNLAFFDLHYDYRPHKFLFSYHRADTAENSGNLLREKEKILGKIK